MNHPTAVLEIMLSVVIVHGAWHVPERYQDLVDHLNSHGFDAQCPRLPTAVETLPLLDTATMKDDTATIKSTLQHLVDKGEKVILLMHSYGGVVGTNALDGLLWPQRQAQDLPGGVMGLVYMAAFVIPVGTCLNTPFGGDYVPWLDYDKENGVIHIQNPRQAFYGHVESDEEAQKWLDMTVYCPASVNRGVLEFGPYEFLGKGVDATYLVCKRDLDLTLEAQEGMATLLGESRTMEYSEAGHCAMVGGYVDDIVSVVRRAWQRMQSQLES